MFLFDLVGAALTLVTLAFLGLGGYAAALRLLRGEASADPLAVAVATLLAATVEAVGIGLVLGVSGLLRLELALALEALLTIALLLPWRRDPQGFAAPFRLLMRRAWARLREHPALALVALHAAGSELLRGLFRPPLSWDSLMTHLLLAATWLQEGAIRVVHGAVPVNYFGYETGNGALWFWWWLAPSHSELWVNLASAPHWLLLGLAVGALARELGAARHWPVAAYLALLTPAIVRFVAAQYVDLFLGSAFAAAAFFGLRWARRASWADAALAGAALGVAAGAKMLGPPYCLALGLALAAIARGDWRRRLAHLGLALVLAAALGSYFFVRNAALGVGPMAIACTGTGEGTDPVGRVVPGLPRQDSVLTLWGGALDGGTLLDVFLGATRPPSLELGVGPQALVLLLAAATFPFLLAPERRRAGLALWSQVVVQSLFWLAIPYANNNHVYANVRYLVPAVALVFAGGVAAAERRGVGAGWLQGIAIAFSLQGLLQLHAEMPRPVRLALALADLAAVALALSPGLRAFSRRRAPALAAAAAGLALLAAPLLATYRVADRGRAFAQDLSVHLTSSRLFAAGWAWLDRHAGDGTVAVSGHPGNYFVYPAMGPHLERRAVYVNVNAADLPRPGDYPRCDPRADLSPEAWVANLRKAGARWVYLNRYPEFEFAAEDRWAAERPGLFALRFADWTNRIYEFLPAAAAGGREGT